MEISYQVFNAISQSWDRATFRLAAPRSKWLKIKAKLMPAFDFEIYRYVGAASYPIEMVILADKSGSMKGRRNTICNATISELLNTLTDDDFFNVIYVRHQL